jgi:hypothetical protein
MAYSCTSLKSARNTLVGFLLDGGEQQNVILLTIDF